MDSPGIGVPLATAQQGFQIQGEGIKSEALWIEDSNQNVLTSWCLLTSIWGLKCLRISSQSSFFKILYNPSSPYNQQISSSLSYFLRDHKQSASYNRNTDYWQENTRRGHFWPLHWCLVWGLFLPLGTLNIWSYAYNYYVISQRQGFRESSVKLCVNKSLSTHKVQSFTRCSKGPFIKDQGLLLL